MRRYNKLVNICLHQCKSNKTNCGYEGVHSWTDVPFSRETAQMVQIISLILEKY